MTIIQMGEKTLQVCFALTLLSIGALYLFQNISIMLRLPGGTFTSFYMIASWAVIILSIITAALIIADALRIRDQD